MTQLEPRWVTWKVSDKVLNDDIVLLFLLLKFLHYTRDMTGSSNLGSAAGLSGYKIMMIQLKTL